MTSPRFVLLLCIVLSGCQCGPECPEREGCPAVAEDAGLGGGADASTADPGDGGSVDGGARDGGAADAGVPGTGGEDGGLPGCIARRGTCSDGIDDDHDGLIDCADRDCADQEACLLPIPTGVYVRARGGGELNQLELRADGGCVATVGASPRDCAWRVSLPSPRLELEGTDGGRMFSYPLRRQGDVLFLDAAGDLALGRLTGTDDAGGPNRFFNVGPAEDGVAETFASNSYGTGYGFELEAQDRLVILNANQAWIRGPADSHGPGPLISTPDAGTAERIAGYQVRLIAPTRGRYTVLTHSSGLYGPRMLRFRADGRPYRYVLGDAYDLKGQTGSESVLVTDVTRDGRPDVVLTAGCGLRAFAQLTDGGLERSPRLLGTPNACFGTAHDAQLADLNGDGLQDVFLEAAGRPHSLLAQQDGGYDVVSGPFAAGVWPRMAPLSRRDGGPPDLAITAAGSVTRFTPDGGGGWLPVGTVPSAGMGDHYTLSGDLDGDGQDDLLKITGGGFLELFRGGEPPAVTQTLMYAGLVPGDFTCRGRPSLLWNNGKILSLERDGGFEPLESVETYPGYFPKAIDVEGDGKLDVVAMGVSGVRVLRRHEGRWAASEYPSPTSLNYNPNALAVGDFTGDSCPDVVVANFNVGASIFIGHCP